jgi:Asp-tRNA(Asn)/Glu-tRNA(Gln) amidotransferase C subunit
MLARMEIGVATMQRMAAVAGFAWSDAELEAIRPAVERLLEALARLEHVPLGAVEPTTQYRVL